MAQQLEEIQELSPETKLAIERAVVQYMETVLHISAQILVDNAQFQNQMKAVCVRKALQSPTEGGDTDNRRSAQDTERLDMTRPRNAGQPSEKAL